MTAEAICEYCGEEGASLQRLGGNLKVQAHICCWHVADYCYGGDTPREEAEACPHELTELDPVGLWSETPPVRAPPDSPERVSREGHKDIEGRPCQGELEVESDKTLYCNRCGAIVSRATGELLGHGSPYEPGPD